MFDTITITNDDQRGEDGEEGGNKIGVAIARHKKRETDWQTHPKKSVRWRRNDGISMIFKVVKAVHTGSKREEKEEWDFFLLRQER